jgi:hypothetical protein
MELYQSNFTFPPPTRFDVIAIEWGPPLMFSIVCVVLGYAIIKITKMHYSRTITLTRLSYYPYIVIVSFLIFEAIEIILIMYFFNTLTRTDASKISFSSILLSLVGTFSIGKFVIYTIFIIS